MAELPEILKAIVQAGASDLIVAPNEPPIARLNGILRKMSNVPPANAAECKRWIYSVLDEHMRKTYEQKLDLDCAIDLPGIGRFRTNVFSQLHGTAAAFRVISTKIPSPEEIGLTPAIQKLADLPRGLVLVTGPTGSGKTTTLACLIDMINAGYPKHILTIEDPIEYVYTNKLAVVQQRNVGAHTESWAAAVRASLRENPDVILIGEIRDAETAGMALSAAETGHLCFSTLHTNDAPSTVDRVINEFPHEVQDKIRAQLGAVLQAVVSQTLVIRQDGTGRVCAREVMLMNSGVAAQIREGKIHELYSTIESSAELGMLSLDQSLVSLLKQGLISLEAASSKTRDPENLKKLYKMHGGGTVDMSQLNDPLAIAKAQELREKLSGGTPR